MNTTNYFIFKINDFQLNKPLNLITTKNEYLSCQDINNIVDFYECDDNSGRQKWIIEKESYSNEIYYIRTFYNRYNNTNYLGCPNKDNNVYLYTTKNKFTRWNISLINESLQLYKIIYIGEKFNNNDVQLVIVKISDNMDWIVPYNDISIIYNVDNINNTNYNKIYLHYIINNYNNLPNKVIFSHTDAIINNITFLYGIDNYEYHENIQPLSLNDNKLITFNKIRTNYNLEYDIIKINGDLINKHYNNHENYKQIFNNPNLSVIEIILIKTSFVIKNKNYQEETINSLLNGIFSINKLDIVKNSYQSYERLFNFINESNNDIILQYLWLYIFS